MFSDIRTLSTVLYTFMIEYNISGKIAKNQYTDAIEKWNIVSESKIKIFDKFLLIEIDYIEFHNVNQYISHDPAILSHKLSYYYYSHQAT